MDTMTALRATDFWNKVNIKTRKDCWLWLKGRTGSYKGAGQYGRTRFNGKADLAHRVAYFLTNGDIPPGGQILHSCDTPLCCNPKHLRLGTPADNMRDKVKRGRATGWPLGKPRNHAIVNQTGLVRDAKETL